MHSKTFILSKPTNFFSEAKWPPMSEPKILKKKSPHIARDLAHKTLLEWLNCDKEQLDIWLGNLNIISVDTNRYRFQSKNNHQIFDIECGYDDNDQSLVSTKVHQLPKNA